MEIPIGANVFDMVIENRTYIRSMLIAAVERKKRKGRGERDNISKPFFFLFSQFSLGINSATPWTRRNLVVVF